MSHDDELDRIVELLERLTEQLDTLIGLTVLAGG